MFFFFFVDLIETLCDPFASTYINQDHDLITCMNNPVSLWDQTTAGRRPCPSQLHVGGKIYIHPTVSQRCQLWNWTNSLQLNVHACTYNCFKDCSIFDLLGCKFLTIRVCILFYYGFSNVGLVFKLYAFFYWLRTFIFVLEELNYEEYPGGYSKLDFSCLGSDLHCLT